MRICAPSIAALALLAAAIAMAGIGPTEVGISMDKKLGLTQQAYHFEASINAAGILPATSSINARTASKALSNSSIQTANLLAVLSTGRSTDKTVAVSIVLSSTPASSVPTPMVTNVLAAPILNVDTSASASTSNPSSPPLIFHWTSTSTKTVHSTAWQRITVTLETETTMPPTATSAGTRVGVPEVLSAPRYLVRAMGFLTGFNVEGAADARASRKLDAVRDYSPGKLSSKDATSHKNNESSADITQVTARDLSIKLPIPTGNISCTGGATGGSQIVLNGVTSAGNPSSSVPRMLKLPSMMASLLSQCKPVAGGFVFPRVTGAGLRAEVVVRHRELGKKKKLGYLVAGFFSTHTTVFCSKHDLQYHDFSTRGYESYTRVSHLPIAAVQHLDRPSHY